jgi:glycosyltransferase involved in cell wall biosynthesis
LVKNTLELILLLTLQTNLKPKINIKNILFISSWYPNDEDPTLGIFIKRHAYAAATLNNVAVLIVRSNSKITKYKTSFKEEGEIKEMIITYPKISSSIKGISSILKIRRYKKYHEIGLQLLIKKGFNPDIVHCNVINPVGIIAKLFKQKHAIPFIVTEHWTGYLKSDGRYQKNKLLKITIPKIAKLAEVILPVSLDLKRALEQHGIGDNYKIVRNVVNTNDFIIQDKPKNQFLVVADLENKQKNISGIIKAFALISKPNPNIKLKIAGGGVDEKDIKTLVNQLNLNEQVLFLGRVPASVICKEFNRSFAGLLFSNYENLPCVIVEAFACGTPFISTNVGGINEIINSERGILIEPNSEEQLVSAMNEAMTTTWDSVKIRNYAEQNFSEEFIGKEFNKVYNSIKF